MRRIINRRSLLFRTRLDKKWGVHWTLQRKKILVLSDTSPPPQNRHHTLFQSRASPNNNEFSTPPSKRKYEDCPLPLNEGDKSREMRSTSPGRSNALAFPWSLASLTDKRALRTEWFPRPDCSLDRSHFQGCTVWINLDWHAGSFPALAYDRNGWKTTILTFLWCPFSERYVWEVIQKFVEKFIKNSLSDRGGYRTREDCRRTLEAGRRCRGARRGRLVHGWNTVGVRWGRIIIRKCTHLCGCNGVGYGRSRCTVGRNHDE